MRRLGLMSVAKPHGDTTASQLSILVYLLSRLQSSTRLEAVKSQTALALVSECAVKSYRVALLGLISPCTFKSVECCLHKQLSEG